MFIFLIFLTANPIRYPRFNGRSWLAFPPLRGAYKHVQISLEFRPESWDGILFLASERDDLVGDFMAILLHNGFLEFRLVNIKCYIIITYW